MLSQVDVKCIEMSCNFIFMTLWILVVNFIEYFVFIIPLLGIIFCLFYTADREREDYAVAHFCMYSCLLTDDGRMNN